MTRRLAGIVTLLLVLSTAAPVLACMTGAAMDQEQNACCGAMHGNCGTMTKSGCCGIELRTNLHPQLAAKTALIELDWGVIAWIAPAPTHATTLFSHEARIEHSPPGLVTAKTAFLRI